MKFLIIAFIFLLPFHAVFVTYLKCKLWLDTNLIRFWKEIIIVLLLAFVSLKVLIDHKFKVKEIYKNNYLLWTATAFILCSAFYIIFPYLDIRLTSLLWFKYDVFFIFAFIIWLYLVTIKENFDNILKTIFASIWLMIIIFLPWYLSWNISTSSDIIGYSKEVSSYEANWCISFAQNVTWWHNRFQWSFGDPIRFWVFLVVFYFIYIWFILHKELNNKLTRNILIIIPSIFVLISIFFSYTKTSMLWFLFWICLFIYLVRKIKFKKEITKKFILNLWFLMTLPLLYLAVFKMDLFLHPEAILWRTENLAKSVEMFYYNPFWYGLWIAWPASQLATSSDRLLSDWVNKFLPENWYVQLVLEQWLLWFFLFLWLLFVIWLYLYRILKLKRDYLSISIFVSFITIIFMWNFTHVFEEAATSYILFLIIWAYISKEYKRLKL